MTGITALNPFFLSLLPLAALPIVFHLFFRLRKQARPFPTLLFFTRIDPKLNARRRLRQWLILLLRTLLIVFLLLTLARPLWIGVGREGSVAVAIVLDNSGSMSGTDEQGRSKLKRAADAARSIIQQLRDQDSAGLVLLVDDPLAALPTGLTRDKAALRAALEQAAETEASGSVARAVERAMAMLEGSDAAHLEIHILSDLQQDKWGQAPTALRTPRRGTSIVVHRLASPRADRANVTLAGVKGPAHLVLAGRRVPIEATLANQSSLECSVRLEWQDDAGNRGTIEQVMPPRSDKTLPLEIEVRNPGFRWVTLALEGDDFTADNRAAAGFFCGEKRRVVFGGSNTAFGLLPLAMSPSGGGRLSGLTPSFADGAELDDALRPGEPGFVALHGESLAGGNAAARWALLRRFLAGGGSALLVPSLAGLRPDNRPDWLAISMETMQSVPNGLAVTVADRSHSLFDDLRDDKGEVGLRNVRAFKFCPLRGGATNSPILALEDGRSLLLEQKVGNGRLLVSGLAFDTTWSTLPLKPGFVVFAQNLATVQGGAATNLITLVAGEPLHAGFPEANTLQVQSLAGSALDWKGKQADLPTLPRSGIYAVRSGGETVYVAVRCADKEGRQKFLAGSLVPGLGNLAYRVVEFTGSEALISELKSLEKSLDLGPVLLALALLCLLAEGWLANPPPIQARSAQDSRRQILAS